MISTGEVLRIELLIRLDNVMPRSKRKLSARFSNGILVLLALAGILSSQHAYSHGLTGDRLSKLNHEIEHHPEKVELRVKKARLLRDAERWGEAIEALDAALKYDPDFAEAYFWYADILYRQKELHKAREKILIYTQRESSSPHGFYLYGTILFELQKYREASKQFNKSIGLDSKPSPQLFLDAVDAFEKAWPKDYQGRRALLEKALNAKGALIVFIEKLVDLEIEFQQYQVAVEHLAHLPQHVLSTPKWRLQKAKLLQLAGKTEDAIEQYQLIIEAIDRFSKQKQNLPAIIAIRKDAEKQLGLLNHT